MHVSEQSISTAVVAASMVVVDVWCRLCKACLRTETVNTGMPSAAETDVSVCGCQVHQQRVWSSVSCTQFVGLCCGCACCRLWGKLFERASAAKADFDAASMTAFLWAASTAGESGY